MGLGQLAARAVRGAVAVRKGLQKAARTALLYPLQSLSLQLVLLAINAYLLARSASGFCASLREYLRRQPLPDAVLG